jgi:phosphopantothenoylcysteine decarboxylase / phosphopantothenate---cysteine ligase
MSTSPKRIAALAGRHVLLAVTGSIACYKIIDLASKLTQAGPIVDVIMSASAGKFVTPMTFQSVTGRPVHTDLWTEDAHVLHVGLADDLIGVTLLAAHCLVICAPAMDGGMFAHPATQTNVQTLLARGVVMVGPIVGRMASGMSGLGRMVEPAEIYGAIRHTLCAGGPLAGRTVVVTAGGTQEAIDPVRMISNRSSGKQGFALAQAALDLGASVTLITGPAALETPHGARRINVISAAEMADAVLRESVRAHALIMAAAVADFRPARTAAEKIKKTGEVPVIELERTLDIISTVAAHRRETGWPAALVGFAAESHNVLACAQDKLHRKGLDMVVANDVSEPGAGFNVDVNYVTLVYPDRLEALPMMDKSAVAEHVLARVLGLMDGVRVPEEAIAA